MMLISFRSGGNAFLGRFLSKEDVRSSDLKLFAPAGPAGRKYGHE
ncbi:hypothetical protein Daudx_0489 [Candidatus Desulforudis audaxviator]|nr:hypothetical protein Daudx_0489 [Candidatus Desulforudis audaxviator]